MAKCCASTQYCPVHGRRFQPGHRKNNIQTLWNLIEFCQKLFVWDCGQECLGQPIELDVKAKWGDSCGDRRCRFLCLAVVRVRCGRWQYSRR